MASNEHNHGQDRRDHTAHAPGRWLDRELRHDAGPWREAIEAGQADRIAGDRRPSGRSRWRPMIAPLASAAGLALAVGLGIAIMGQPVTLEPDGARRQPGPTDRQAPAGSLRSAAPAPTPTHNSRANSLQFGQLPHATPSPDQPMLEEVDRLAQDAEQAFSYVVTNVPGASSGNGNGKEAPTRR